jgi:hypothetical protein
MAASGDNENFKITQEQFYGGASVDKKIGIPNSYFFSQALDARKKPSEISVLPAMRDISSNSLKDLILNMETGPDGTRYAIGDKGWFYRMNSSNQVSIIDQLTSDSSAGLVYNQNTDSIYIAGQQTVSRYGLVQRNPTLVKDNFAQSVSTDPGVTQLYNPSDALYDGLYRSSGSLLYNIKSTLSEADLDKCNFQPDIEPSYSVKVYITNKGTGDITLTLHDPLNATLATVTILNANLKNNSYNEFKFSSQVRLQIKPAAITYHLHLTSTTNDAQAQVAMTNDMTGLNFQLYAYRLIQTNNKLHPMEFFTKYLCIGNGNYLSTYDFSFDGGPSNQSWVRNALTFPPGFEVCGMTINDQYLVISLEKRSTNGQRNYQNGYLAFWDGISGSANFFINIPMRPAYSPQTINNITYFYINGSLYAWAGGKTIMKVRTLAYTDTEYTNTIDTTMSYPYMMATRNNVLMCGYPSQTSNTNINMGIYSWGSIEMQYPNSFYLSYVNSQSMQRYTAGNNLRQGMVKSYGDTMYLSYQYVDANSVTHNGLDVVDNFSPPAAFSEFQSLIFDGGQNFNVKNMLRYQINTLPLPVGATVTPKYSLERGGFIYGKPITAGGVSTKLEIDQRFFEGQWGFEISCLPTTVVSPVITAVVVEIDPLPQELDL